MTLESHTICDENHDSYVDTWNEKVLNIRPPTLDNDNKTINNTNIRRKIITLYASNHFYSLNELDVYIFLHKTIRKLLKNTFKIDDCMWI